MTTVNQARFTIDGTPSEDPTTGDQGYVATLAQTLDCTLEISPSSALSVTYSIYDPTDESSPMASYGAPSLTWVGSGLSSQTLTSPNGTAQIIMPGAGVGSFIIRCTAVMPEGAHVYERLVAINAATVPAIRKTVPAEVNQFYARGWSDEQNKMVDAILGIVAPVGIDSFGSAGTYQGTWVVDAGGAMVNVAAGTGWLRTTASVTGTLVAVTWLASAGIAIPADSTRYIGVEYNGGAPQVVSRVANSFTGLNDFILATVYNEAGTLHILEHEQSTQDGLQGCFSRFFNNFPLSRAERAGGLIVGDTGVRNLTMSAGILYDGLSAFTIAAIDTSAASTFDYYYRDGFGDWTVTAAQTQYSNIRYDDGTGVLHALTHGNYGITWWYLESDGHIVGLYGWGDYASLADAEDATPPSSIPGRITAHGILIGRTIVLEGAAAATEVESVFSVEFGMTAVTSHNSLGGLQGGGAGEYYHLTAAQTSDLTDGGICTSHLHDLDQCYGAAAATITADAWDVTWNLTGAFSHVTNLAGCTGNVDGFFVEDGADFFRLTHKAADTLAATGQFSSLQLDSSADISLDSVASSNFTITANSAGAEVLTLRCTQAGAGTSEISVYATDDISVRSVEGSVSIRGVGPVLGNGISIEADAGGGSIEVGCNAGTNQVSLGGAGARNVYVGSTSATGATIQAEQIAVGISVDSAGAHQIALSAINIGAGTATIGLTADDAVTIDSTAAGVSIDGVGDSNFTVTANAVGDKTLLLSATNAGGGAGLVAFSDGYKAGSTFASALVLSDASAEWSTFESNFGEVSILNALNQCASTAVTLDEAYNAGTATVTVDAYDTTWNLTGAYSFVLDLAGCTGALDGFQITNGTDFLSVLRGDTNKLALTSEFETFDLNVARDVTIDSGTWVAITTGVNGFSINTNQFFVDQTNGRIGVGVIAPSVDFAFGGESNRTIAVERRTVADTGGKSLTCSAGGATLGATNKDGGDFKAAGGISTGSGTSGFKLYAYPGIAAATVDNVPVEMIYGTAALLTLGDTTGATATTVRTGTGALTMTAGGIFDVNATGAITLDSTAGTIGIGTGADAFGINIGTGAAARTITIGNVTGATGVTVNTGSGDFCVNTNQLYVDQATGFVGVGLVLPTARLHVVGDFALDATTAGPAAWFNNNGAGRILSFNSAYAEKGYIDAIGDIYQVRSDVTNRFGVNCGFGTATPLQKINVQSGAIRFDYVPTLSAAGCTFADGAAGVNTAGVHSLKFTAVNALGETELGTASPNYTVVTNEQKVVSNCPISPDPTVTSRNVYACKAGAPTTWYKIAGLLPDNTTTECTINVADASLVTSGTSVNNTTAGKILNGTIGTILFDATGSVSIGGNGTRTIAASGYTDILANSNAHIRLMNITGGTAYGDFGIYGVGIGAAVAISGQQLCGLGTSAGIWGLLRHSTANTAGNSLSLIAGGATSGATDKNGGPLLLLPGVSTGAGTSYVAISAYPGIAAATTDNTAVEVARFTALGVGVGTTAPSAWLDLERAGTAKSIVDFMEITNTVNAADMDGTGTGILFNQFYYDAATPAVVNAAKIAALCETDWTSVAGTQNSALSFWTRSSRGLEETARLDSQTNLLLGITATDANVRKSVTIGMTTAEPSGAVADAIQIFGAESSDGNATLGLYLEQAVEVIGTFTASHKIKLKINGTEYWAQLDAVAP